jgi:hypothetical protein
MHQGHIRSTNPDKIQRKATTAALLVLGLLSVILPALIWTFSHSSSPDRSSSNLPADSSSFLSYWNWNNAAFSPAAQLSTNHPVYPYSVIPGGAHSRRELSEAVQREPVVATHYVDFSFGKAHVIRLTHERQAYVSYRLGNQIYWTKKKLTLRKGETILSDGKHLARTRCGNRISEVPTGPTSPSEPAEKVLNHPLPPRILEPTDSPLPEPIWSDGSIPSISLPSAPGGTGPGMPFFPPFPCCGTSPRPSPSPSPEPVPQPYPPPVVATPEPSSLVLLLAGSVTLFIFWKFRRP